MQLVFQDPYASLNPRMTVLELVAEPLVVHGIAKNPRGRATAGRRPARSLRASRPTPSTAIRTRSAAASASGSASPVRSRCSPTFIVADEPVSALDVSVRAQVVNLLQDLQHEFGLTYLFIAHDLSVVRHISHRIAILYCGRARRARRAPPTSTSARAPVHRGAAVERADPRSAGATGPAADRAVGRDPEPRRPAARVPVPDPMPARRAAVPRRDAAARGEGARPLGRLLRPLMIQDPVPRSVEPDAAATPAELDPRRAS